MCIRDRYYSIHWFSSAGEGESSLAYHPCHPAHRACAGVFSNSKFHLIYDRPKISTRHPAAKPDMGARRTFPSQLYRLCLWYIRCRAFAWVFLFADLARIFDFAVCHPANLSSPSYLNRRQTELDLSHHDRARGFWTHNLFHHFDFLA